jgi:stearoyl-CoA desaturase (delta-9 desaturase)
LAFAAFLYGSTAMGCHGTFWLHRYCTHRAFTFTSPWIRAISRNLVIKVIPEEIYVVSHHVHHQLTERPGDPYNAHGGFWYCFFADVNHQTVNKNLSKNRYQQLLKYLDHTGVRVNSYEEYQKWGSICNPLHTVVEQFLNWSFWFAAFYFIGGISLVVALFGSAGVWAFGIRTFNYDGHGAGKDKRQDGIDFNRRDLSVNQMWPGYVAGEWHNNHHLFPSSAKCGFLPYQLDLPWILIWSLHQVKAVSAYRNDQWRFEKYHLTPYLLGLKEKRTN